MHGVYGGLPTRRGLPLMNEKRGASAVHNHKTIISVLEGVWRVCCTEYFFLSKITAHRCT